MRPQGHTQPNKINATTHNIKEWMEICPQSSAIA